MKRTRKQTVIVGSGGKLRPIWRAAIYYALGTWAVFPLLDSAFAFVTKSLHVGQGLTAAYIGLGEFRNLIDAFILTGAFALYERRRVDSYGLPINRAFGSETFEGAAAGVIMASAVAVGMLSLGGMQIEGLARSGSSLVLSALAWLGASICVGLAEEFWFRSYLQQTLWKSIGFWPASSVIAAIFAAEHYFFKNGENIWDVITLVSLSLLLSYTILRTGTLWFAVGFHLSFDYMQLFVIGTPNGARFPVGRLLDATFHGPAWLTGGVLGVEASLLMYPAIALLWVYVWWRFRANPPLRP
jgi:CAAX protease family protein